MVGPELETKIKIGKLAVIDKVLTILDGLLQRLWVRVLLSHMFWPLFIWSLGAKVSIFLSLKSIVIQYLHLFSLLQQNAIDRGLIHSRNFFLRVPEAGKFKLKHQ